ncbi:MAG: thioredoxin [Verrucomicrobiia bacterium]
MASANIVELTSKNFKEQVLDATGVVLVDFWAEWCGPCKMIAPVLDQIADQHVGKVKITKVNVDHASDLAAQFNIRSIPTLLIFQDGTVKDQLVGVLPKKVLEEKLGLTA